MYMYVCVYPYRSMVQMVLNTSIGRKVPTQAFNTDYGNARGGATKDGANTCEKVMNDVT